MLSKIWNIILLLILFIASSAFSSEKLESISDSFVIIGDSQRLMFLESFYWEFWGEHNEKETKALFKEIAKRKPDFVLHLGDFVNKGSSSSAWSDFEEDTKPIIEANIPIIPLLGNHEYFGNVCKTMKIYQEHFPIMLGRTWNSFIYKGIGIIVFNSNFDELSEAENNEQLQWYRSELKAMESDTAISKIIIAVHHPFFTNSKIVSPGEELNKYYLNSFLKNSKTAAAFSGHCHSYEKFLKNDKYIIVSGGGGGARQKLNIDKSSRKYKDLFDGAEKRFFHFLYVKVYENHLLIEVVKLNDNFTFSIADTIKIML